jgi:putative aldouronate transport system permease protein
MKAERTVKHFKINSHKNKFNISLDQLSLQSMVWPGIIFLIVFSYWPMYGIVMAFQKFDIIKGYMGSQWIGLENFKAFMVDESFFLSLRNTLGMNVLSLAIGFPATIIFALFLNEITSPIFKRVTQTVSYLPYFISWAVYGGIILNILAVETGAVNALLMKLGIIDEGIFFMGEPRYFWFIAVFSGLIKGIGFNAILYLAAIAGVDQELIEASVIDGAGRFGRMWHVILPSISGTIVILLIFSISGLLNSGFDQIWMLQNPLNLDMSETIDTFVYKMGIREARYSYSAAVGLFKSVIALILLLGANLVSKKISDKSLF